MVDRQKEIKVALAKVEKEFGKGSVMILGQENYTPIEGIPTGSLAVDYAIGCGGLPRGRVVEIYQVLWEEVIVAVINEPLLVRRFAIRTLLVFAEL